MEIIPGPRYATVAIREEKRSRVRNWFSWDTIFDILKVDRGIRPLSRYPP